MKKSKNFYGRTAAAFAAVCLFNAADSHAMVLGDVNGDGIYDTADVVSLCDYLLGVDKPIDPRAADMYSDGSIDVFDLCAMRKDIVSFKKSRVFRVTNTAELKDALSKAFAGTEIILAPGEYVYEGSTPKGHMFIGEVDGTEAEPIILRSEDKNDPAVISGFDVSKNYALTITGDWWEIRDLKIANASKGIIADNADHTRIIGCEVYNIGAEGIHLRDDSSYCLVEECSIHDTGIISPAYGEGIYVGSSKSTSGYGYKCDYNVIRNCNIGPNVAAEHVDVKEYTTGTIIEDCTFDGTGMSGENYADSFVDLKGNDCILRHCTAYRNGAENIHRAFEMNKMDEGWGRNGYIYGNRAYMDKSINDIGKKMVMVNAWNCSVTVWDNLIAYEDGELVSCEDTSNRYQYYNCNEMTYGDSSLEKELP